MICLDTEFSDFPPEMQLLSLGLCQVDGDRSFYVECDDMPEFGIGLSYFVRANVLPHMTGPRAPRGKIGEMLRDWLYQLPRPVLVLTDAPEFDWFLMKESLGVHARGLMLEPCRFDSLTLGVEFSMRLQNTRANYYGIGRPEHHALHDALALREQVREAMRLGWAPL